MTQDEAVTDRRGRIALQPILWAAIVSLCALRFWGLSADFPNHSRWMLDQAKYTDEGWWDGAAVMHHLTGHWTVPGDYNPAVAVPVWPLLLTLLFHWTGISLLAARALNVALSIGNVALVYLLVRRHVTAGREFLPLLAALLLAASPFAFVYSRLAVLDTFVVFQLCLCLLVASCASSRRMLFLALIAVLVTSMVLTKTTGLALVPAVACMMLLRLGLSAANGVRVLLAVGVAPAAAYLLYRLTIETLGRGPDYLYFFSVNASDPIDWSVTLAMLRHLVADCLWVDRILYPAAAAALVASVVWLRGLWKNPLFTACCVAIAGQLAFLFKLQDNYAPRHFLPLLVPVVCIVALALGECKLRFRPLYWSGTAIVAISATMNLATIVSISRHRTYQFYDAARSIQQIIARDSTRNRIILGVSGAQLGLLTANPSLNDVYGTDDLTTKVRRYDPEWFTAWNGVGDEDKAALASYRMEKIASYPAFDDEGRDVLLLFHLVRVPGQE